MNEFRPVHGNDESSKHIIWGGTKLSGGVTPVPNQIFDVWMPSLTDTQLRVLLIVVRSTLGWQNGESRKASDWLSHRQLQARTGRAGAAVSTAIEALVRHGLLEVQDGTGERRMTAKSRRAARGPLFYGLGEALTSQSEVFDSATTTMREGQNWNETSHVPDMTSQGRLHKAKTTKENETKKRKRNNDVGEIRLDLSSLENEVINIGEAQISELEAPTSKGNPEHNGGEPETQDLGIENLDLPMLVGPEDGSLNTQNNRESEMFIRFFQSTYTQVKPDKICPRIEEADIIALERMLGSHGMNLLKHWLPRFFTCQFGYVRRREWSLRAYLESIFILIVQGRKF